MRAGSILFISLWLAVGPALARHSADESPAERRLRPGTDYAPRTEAGRLGRIWTAYQSYRAINVEIFAGCQAVGVDMGEARVKNEKFDKEVLAKMPVLEARLKAAMQAEGEEAPDVQLQFALHELEATTKIRVGDLLLKLNPAAQMEKCIGWQDRLSDVQGSFRFSDYYEQLMAL